jgi:hypothetical protein
MVCPLRRHAAFIFATPARTLPQAETGTSRHERRESAFPLPPAAASACRSSGLRLPLPLRGALVAAVSRFAIVTLSSRLATKTPGALCSVSTLTASSMEAPSDEMTARLYSAHGIPSLDLFEVAGLPQSIEPAFTGASTRK